MLAILDRRLEAAGGLAGEGGADLREVLDRLIEAFGGRDSILTDLAPQVRFRSFDQPVIGWFAASAGAKIAMDSGTRTWTGSAQPRPHLVEAVEREMRRTLEDAEARR